MRTPFLRTAGACLVAAVYYWLLLANPFATPSDGGEAQLRQDIQTSGSAFAAGRFAAALAPTERLAKAMPSQALYADRLARIYHAVDRPDDEAREWERLITLSPTPIDACPMVADAYGQAGHSDLALDALERCASFTPANPDFLLSLGQALLAHDRPADARKAFERGLEVDSRYPDLHLLVGVQQFDAGELADAKASFERFAALAPDRSDEVAEWLGRVKGVK